MRRSGSICELCDYLEGYRVRQLQLAGLRHPDTHAYGWLVMYREDEQRRFATAAEQTTLAAVSLVLAAQFVQECTGERQIELRSISGNVQSPDPRQLLTIRQQQVLGMVEIGMPNKLIARGLKISENTLKALLKAIYERLGVQSRTQAIDKISTVGRGRNGAAETLDY